MEIRYQLFEDECLLIQKFSGSFSFEKFKRYSQHVLAEYAGKKVEKVLLDFRDIRISDSVDEIPEEIEKDLDKVVQIRTNINRNKLKDKPAKLVIWVDNPQSTVMAHLFVNRFPAMDYEYCSTAHNVIKLLRLPPDFNEPEKLVQTLENSF